MAFLQHIEADWFIAQSATDRSLVWATLISEGKAKLVADLRGALCLESDDDDVTAPIGNGPIGPIEPIDNPNE